MREGKGRLCFWLFVFGISVAFFHILPALLTRYLAWPLSWGDMLDFLTPFAIIPLATILYFQSQRIIDSTSNHRQGQPSLKILTKIIIAFGFLCYAEGHGLHLSANSIARLLVNMKESDVYRATYLYDEVISHFIWIIGLFLISVALLLIASKHLHMSLSGQNYSFLFAGAAAYGFAFTLEAIEGQTVIFTFPAAGAGFLLAFLFCWKKRREGFQNPVLLFFIAAYLLSLLLFLSWGVSHSGFPQFSELGWI